jgi:predicted MFS family arabinose efflux permease
VAPDVPVRPAIFSGALLIRLVSVVATAVGFYLPLAVTPLYAQSATGSSSDAGLANGALLVATVLAEMATPRIVRTVGYRWALAIGLVVLGAPAIVLLAEQPLFIIITVSAVRGVGFAVAIVAGGALTAALIPAERRGEGLALVGLVGGLASLIALPAGVWAADQWGFGIVFAVTAAATLAALLSVPWLPRREASRSQQDGVLAGLRSGALTRPATIFAASAAAAGVVVTYLPLAVGRSATWVATVALLLQPAAATLARLGSGRIGDRRGQTGLLIPGVLASIAGMAAMSMTHAPAQVLAGAVVFGAGFGFLQNSTLSLMYARAAPSQYSSVSAIWNAAFDMGMAVGAIGVGLMIGTTGYSSAFLIVAVAMLPALILARRENAREPGSARRGDS